MAANIRQGDIVEVKGLGYLPLVLNNNENNRDTKIMVCPVIKENKNNSKHVYIEGSHIKGYACTDQVRRINLLARQYKAIDHIDYDQISEISHMLKDSMNFF